MATLYSTNTTLQDILNMRVGDELRLSGGDIPEYTEEDAGKTLQVNQSGTGLEWGSELPSYTSSDVGKVLTVGEDAEHSTTETYIPEQTITFEHNIAVIPNVSLSPEDLSLGMEAEMTLVIDGQTITENMTTAVFIGVDAIVFQDSSQNYIVGFTPDPGVWAIRMVTHDVAYSGDATILMTSIPAVAPVWQTPGGMQTVTLSDTFNTGVQSLMQTAITEMLTNQTKSAVKIATNILTADDREKIRAACVAWADRQSMFFMFGAYFVPVMAGMLAQDVYGVHTVLPYYSQVVGTNEYWFRVTVVNNSAGSTFLMVELTHSVGGAA